ncbi:MAG: efflux RND transporter periplasmic adaptor subunit [Rikenellaceae bacterium]|nr:efflux RND transporter periplasmic adaptor subunit [Rikenellaceae bacterium]
MITAVIIVVFIGIALLYNFFSKRAAEEALEPQAPTRSQTSLHVNAEIVRQQMMTDGIFTVANLLPDEEVELSFETSGKIVGIYFQEGALVKKGDLLAKINDAPLQAQLARYQAQVKLAEARVFRQSTLLEKDAVSQETYEQATTELATLNADIDLMHANIAQTELRAPFDGVIGLRNVSEGAYASPSTVIAKLTKIDPLKLEFDLPERYAMEVGPGTQLSFTVDGFLQSFHATVYATDASVSIDTRGFLAKAAFPNPNGMLRPGYFAHVELRRLQIPDAISVPAEALVKEMGVDKVYLFEDGKAQPRTVETVIRTDARVQVIEGLQPGDTVLTSGTLQLRTGMNVVLDRIE